MKCSVVLGFSGGIDSTAAALSLREQGYEPLLVTLNTTGDQQMLSVAREAASRLQMQWREADVRESFEKEIIHYFTESYLQGRTPAPCTVCNVAIKWRYLYEIAEAEQIPYIATGHYFRIQKADGRCYVRTACDLAKDQSYYLWGVPQSYLERALTPMGERLKSEVRGSVAEYVDARESMGVCFLCGKSYADFIKERVGDQVRGDVVDRNGTVIGRHDGCALYTIGQKRGLYDVPPKSVVVGIDVPNNRLVVGVDADLYHTTLVVGQCHIIDWERFVASRTMQVKIRGIGRNPQNPIRVAFVDDLLYVSLSDPAWAAAKGQPVVFYDGELVVGGGFLEDSY